MTDERKLCPQCGFIRGHAAECPELERAAPLGWRDAWQPPRDATSDKAPTPSTTQSLHVFRVTRARVPGSCVLCSELDKPLNAFARCEKCHAKELGAMVADGSFVLYEPELDSPPFTPALCSELEFAITAPPFATIKFDCGVLVKVGDTVPAGADLWISPCVPATPDRPLQIGDLVLHRSYQRPGVIIDLDSDSALVLHDDGRRAGVPLDSLSRCV